MDILIFYCKELVIIVIKSIELDLCRIVDTIKCFPITLT